MIYLDNAATTEISLGVMREMRPYLDYRYGNAGAIYKLGRDSAKAISKARKSVADLIHASPKQILFTSGGSEANSMVFLGLRKYLNKIGKRKILISAVEHDSVIRAAESLSDEFCVQKIPVDNKCVVSVDEFKKMLSDDVGLVSVMYVNNETGAVSPIKEIAKMCSEKNVLFHTDCVQAVGGYNIDVDEIGCDFLSISSHKIHGCKGIGALFARNKDLLTPIIYGGADQEFGLRAGTENVPGIVGFGEACREAMVVDRKTRIHKIIFFDSLRRFLNSYNLEHIMRVNGPDPFTHGKILNLSFIGVDASTLLLMLDAKGVCASAGSACRSHELEPSHVLLAMGISPDDARSSIRFSFSRYNSINKDKISAEIVSKAIAEYFEMSHSKQEKS